MPVGLNYFDPGSSYGSPNNVNYGGTPWGSSMLEQNPGAAFLRYGAAMGTGNSESNFDRWFRSQLPRVVQGYQAATVTNPFLTINPYLASLGGLADWQTRFQSMTPQQRGEQPSRFSGPLRWIGR